MSGRLDRGHSPAHVLRLPRPLNVGTERVVTTYELLDIFADAAGEEFTREHDLSKP